MRLPIQIHFRHLFYLFFILSRAMKILVKMVFRWALFYKLQVFINVEINWNAALHLSMEKNVIWVLNDGMGCAKAFGSYIPVNINSYKTTDFDRKWEWEHKSKHIHTNIWSAAHTYTMEIEFNVNLLVNSFHVLDFFFSFLVVAKL